MHLELIWFPVLTLVTLAGVRILRIRIAWWQAIMSAWLGLATAGILITWARGGQPPPVPLVIGLGLIAMIVWAGVFELLSRRRAAPSHRTGANPVRALRGALTRSRRRAEIAIIASRLGLARFARRRASEPRGEATGRALRRVLESAGGVYVKLGQFLSTRPDLVPSEIAAELRRLQEHASPVPAPVIRDILTAELGAGLGECFAAFDDIPAAAASIAQVHSATLPDGRRVAVKIQRPGVADRVRTDLGDLGPVCRSARIPHAMGLRAAACRNRSQLRPERHQ